MFNWIIEGVCALFSDVVQHQPIGANIMLPIITGVLLAVVAHFSMGNGVVTSIAFLLGSVPLFLVMRQNT